MAPRLSTAFTSLKITGISTSPQALCDEELSIRAFSTLAERFWQYYALLLS